MTSQKSSICPSPKDNGGVIVRSTATTSPKKDEIFPLKLHRILRETDQRGLSQIIGWRNDGKSFVIRDKEEMERQVMPLYFNSTKFKSLQRSLNLWGFEKSPQTTGRDGLGGRSHPCFVRGREDLCEHMRRDRVKEPGARSTSRSSPSKALKKAPKITPTSHQQQNNDNRALISMAGSCERQGTRGFHSSQVSGIFGPLNNNNHSTASAVASHDQFRVQSTDQLINSHNLSTTTTTTSLPLHHQQQPPTSRPAAPLLPDLAAGRNNSSGMNQTTDLAYLAHLLSSSNSNAMKNSPAGADGSRQQEDGGAANRHRLAAALLGGGMNAAGNYFNTFDMIPQRQSSLFPRLVQQQLPPSPSFLAQLLAAQRMPPQQEQQRQASATPRSTFAFGSSPGIDFSNMAGNDVTPLLNLLLTEAAMQNR